MPLEEVFEHLKTSPTGLLSGDAEERLKIFGLNKLEEKQVINSLFSKYLHSVPAKDRGWALIFCANAV